MKKFLPLIISVVCLATNFFASYKEVPSLQELAAKKAYIGTEGSKKLSSEMIEYTVLRGERGLHQIMSFITANPEKVPNELFFTIPDKFFQAFLNGTISLNDFSQWIEKLPADSKKKVINAFNAQIFDNIKKSRFVDIMFRSPAKSDMWRKSDRFSIIVSRIKSPRHLIRTERILTKLYIDKNFILGLFVLQRLELMILDALKKYRDDVELRLLNIELSLGESQYIIPKSLINKLDPLIEELNTFSIQQLSKFKDLKEYINGFRDIFNEIRYKNYTELSIDSLNLE